MPRTTDYVIAAALSAFALSSACTTAAPEEPPCVPASELPAATCKPTYDPPDFKTLYAKIFHPTCAAGTGTCHSADGHKNGLVFESEDESYDLLLAPPGAKARVLPGDASCSTIMKRVTSHDRSYEMPPGERLSDGEICAITQWVAAGAKR
jgi:Planctomycete cytochrome C